MSDLLITELAKCTTQKSGVQTCNPSNHSASYLHLGHTDHTATQPGQIVDTMILLIFVQRYRNLSYSLYCHSYFADELFSGCGYSTPNPELETIILIRIQSGNGKFCKI
jgi:hypothetical protein